MFPFTFIFNMFQIFHVEGGRSGVGYFKVKFCFHIDQMKNWVLGEFRSVKPMQQCVVIIMNPIAVRHLLKHMSIIAVPNLNFQIWKFILLIINFYFEYNWQKYTIFFTTFVRRNSCCLPLSHQFFDTMPFKYEYFCAFTSYLNVFMIE